MTKLSSTNVVGYASHLPLKVVKLPLKYAASKDSGDPSENFRNKCFSSSELLDVSSQKGNFFPSVQVGIFNDMKTLRLTPILPDEATLLVAQFQNIDIVLPHRVISAGTITYQFFPLASEVEPFILIDLIEENFLLVTLKIELSDFILGSTKNRLALDSVSEWVNISVPYSFELRLPPLLVKGLDQSNLIVSLRDGGLLHFHRASALSAVDIFNFSEVLPLMSLNFVGSLLKGSKQEISVNDVSSAAVVDVVKLNDSEFVALTVTKTLKFWSLESHKQSRNLHQVKKSDAESTWLTTVTSKHLEVQNFDNTTTLSLLLPVEEQKKQNDYIIYQWHVEAGNLLAPSTITLNARDAFDQPDTSELSILKVQDFQIKHNVSEVAYFVLWKSNTFSSLVCYSQNKSTGSITSTTSSRALQDSLFGDINARHDGEYYEELIFNSGLFDKEIVLTALNIFKLNSGLEIKSDVASLRRNACYAITATSEKIGVSTNSLWVKFALICEEFRKISQESLAILVRGQMVIVSLVNGVGMFTYAHYYESFLSSSNPNRLAQLLLVINSKFSSNTFKKLSMDLARTTKLDTDTTTQLASTYLSGKISNQEINALMKELESIPEVVEEIKLLISGTGGELVVDDRHVSIGEGLGLFAKLALVATFKNIEFSHKEILVKVAVLFLLCEVNESVLDFLNSIIKVLNGYTLMDQVFDLSFSSSSSESSIETSTVSLKENSVFWTASLGRFPRLNHLVQERDYNVAFDYLTNEVLQHQQSKFILNVVLELVNKNEGKIIFEKFISKLDPSLPINHFLSGIVQLLNRHALEFYDTFVDYETFAKVNKYDIKENLLKSLSSNQLLKHFLSSIFSGPSDDLVVKANYYHQLAQLSKSYGTSKNALALPDSASETEDSAFKQQSLDFEKKAYKILAEADGSDKTVSGLRITYLRNLFADALAIKKFDDASDSLNVLSDVLPRSELKVLFTRFVRSLISHHQIDRLFRPSPLFQKNYLLIDCILLELANEDLILSNALKCYEYLYSWRLFGGSSDLSHASIADKRGAAEALYIFVTRFKFEKDSLGFDSNESEDFKQFKLKILELYMIVLNCLRTFENADDKWIVKRDNTKRLGVITLEQLTIEYYKWLKELEKDLMG